MSEFTGIETKIGTHGAPNVLEDREHENEIFAKRVVMMPSNQQLRIEYWTSGNGNKQEKYVGHAARGVGEDITGWVLEYLEYGTNKRIVKKTVAYDSWDNRATAVYA